MPNGGSWTVLWKTITRFERAKIIPWIALRNTIGVIVPLILGLAYHQVAAGLILGTGALNVAFSDGKDPYRQRGRRMLLATLVCGLAVVIGTSTGRNSLPAILIAAVWAFVAGMMVSLGTTAGDLGTVSLVVLVVFAAQPMTPDKAFLSGLLAIAGGLFQTLLAVVSWLRHPYEPEHRILGQLYASLKRMIETHVDPNEPPPATSQAIDARNALVNLSRDYSLESERCLSLLNQAERARLSILAIKRLRSRLRRESVSETPEILDRALAIAAQVSGEVSRLLLHEAVSIHVGAELEELAAMAKSLSAHHAAASANTTDTAAAMIDDTHFQLAALAGQLRSAVSLATHSTGAGEIAFERQEARKPWRLRLTSSLAILRANLCVRSPAFRHALRLAVCITLGVGLGRGLGLLRPYWIPMTIAIVLKPDFSSTFSRGVLRLAGTYVGLIVATALFHVIQPTEVFEITLLIAFTFVCRCIGPANYGILTAAVSGLVVLLIALTGVSPKQVIAARALNTTVGGLLALFAYVLWPTWERTQLPEAVANLLDSYREYLHALARLGSTSPNDEVAVDAKRLAGRLARTNLEASVERYRAEPGARPEQLDRVLSILASSHRMAHALMSLEAELAAHPNRSIPDGFRAFGTAVDRTLELLAAALRGTRPSDKDFPDLREAHTQLVENGSTFGLLNTETDRITNSLNTLHEQILAWMS